YCAFYGCSALPTVTFSSLLTEISEMAFANCTKLNAIEFPEMLTTIGNYAFSSCTAITSIVLPENLTYLGARSFENCSNMTSVVIKDGLQTINEYTFSGCAKLTSVSLPDTVKTIGASAFNGCKKLTSIKCGFDLDSIGNNAFNGCTYLETVTLNFGLRTIGNNAFQDCKALETIEMPITVYELGQYAFSGCTKLKNVTLSERIKVIKPYTFANCTALVNLVLPNGVKEIKDHVFYQDTKLTDVTIPETVTNISDDNVFSYPQRTTIHGVAGSYAQTYATAKNMSFVDITNHASSMQLINGMTQLVIPRTYTILVYPDWFDVLPADNTDKVELTSSDTSVVSVVNGTELKGVKAGTATITATNTNGFSFTFEVVVKNLTSLEITNPPDKTIYALNESFCWDGLEITAVFEDGTRQKLEKWIYDLEGFSSTSIGIKTVTANWCGKTASFEVACGDYHTVTFVDWDGTVLKTQFVYNGEAAEAPEDPIRPGYDFVGWDQNFSNITADLVVTALYEYIPTSLPGDVNGDGEITVNDALMVLRHALSITGDAIGSVGDVNNDGVINVADALVIMRIALGIVAP
ncbi:MAG: leucine-rich repeat protein, partial [Clostridia bacterium]|nr:leucine-rich repeat protein [Clostridia bacterium]